MCREVENLVAHKGQMLVSACVTRQRHFSRGVRGFTLIELLVVIAIIALLVGILFPSLTRAKELARFTLCQQRMKHWGTGFQIYTTIYDGFLPHIDGLDRKEPPPPSDQCGWVDVVPPLLDFKPWRDHEIYKRPGADTFFQCVSAKPLESG